jgi:DNA-nicking Smr family endonuclease
MKVYTYSEARQRLATLLQQARRDGQVQIRRRDGQVFVVSPTAPVGSPLDVPGVDANLARGALATILRESRESSGRYLGPAGLNRRARPVTRGRRRAR